MQPNGYTLYHGPSQLDRRTPIVVLATGVLRSSTNPKTGPMIQTWILNATQHPVAALQSGGDASVCGGCPLRPQVQTGTRYAERGCYVRPEGPSQVWKQWQAGAYPALDRAAFAQVFGGRRVRFGAYGDPVAAPVQVWQAIADVAAGHTGYTHQWRAPRAKPFQRLLQASVESDADAALAQRRGWHTFHVLPLGQTPDPATECDNSRTGALCYTCLKCDGRHGNVTIAAHGIGAQFVQPRKALPQFQPVHEVAA